MRTGPRHAAPKKPLLNRLQMPAGKAIALAAMPTVLMGMGIAQARPMPKNPFQDGPCVTQPDEPPEDAQQDDQATQDPADTGTATPAGKDGQQSDDTGKAAPSPSPSAPRTPKPSDTPKPLFPAPSGAHSSSPAPAPSAGRSEGGGLLGGVGDVLGSVLSPDRDKSSQPAPSSSPARSASAAQRDQSGQPAKDSGSVVDKVTDTAKDTVGKVTDGAKKVTDGLKDTTDEVTDTVEPSPSPSSSAENPLAPDEDGKQAFPCVVEKKVPGKDETTPVTIPDVPWNLEASSLLLKGLDFVGVVNVTTASGTTKQVLKFTADDGVDIGDLHQTVPGPLGKTQHVQAAPGSTSTIRGGRVTMYTERLQGNLFGVIPIVFDPEHPPPLNIPIAYFTNVHVVQAGQFGGNLTIPGLHGFATG